MIKRIYLLSKYLILFFYYKNILHSPKYSQLLYEAVSKLGGLYIKLIQFACLRTEIFTPDQKLLFLSFYDEVPYDDLNPGRIICKELTAQNREKIQSVENKPFASGTFGQVYKGCLIDGTKIIVKIKRPDLYSKLRTDLLLLKIFAAIFDFLYYQKLVDIPTLVSEFIQTTYEELDYVKEAHNADYFYRYYQNHPHLKIPKTYLNLTTQNLLIQEYVGGISLTDLIRLKSTQTPYNKYLEQHFSSDIFFIINSLAYELGKQAFTMDFFYADPHPGNIKILPHNRYALVDFGIIGSSPKNRKNYYNIIKLMIKHAQDLDTQKLGKEFLEWGANKFYRYVELMDDHFSVDNKKLSEILINKYTQDLEAKREKIQSIELVEKENYVKIFLEIIKTGQYLNIKVPPGMLAAMKTVAIWKAWVVFLEPDLHNMRGVYQRIVDTIDYQSLTNREDWENKITLEEALEGLLDWAGEVAENDLPLYRSLKNILTNVSYV
ncbi:AarF/ABC1/UbiB kinase family protein [Candidatus Microgenomates bacterium]|nr:AarF/ABC1/UbiB kinase family protein [Candidatus Microgenomates bacterium]